MGFRQAVRGAADGLLFLAGGEAMLLARLALPKPLPAWLDYPTIILGFVLIGIGGFRVLWSVLSPLLPARWRRLQRVSDEELQQRCRDLSQKILRFLGARDRHEPWRRPHWFGQPARASETRKRRDFEQSVTAGLEYDAETLSWFREEFWGESLGLADACIKRGWLQASERNEFRFLVNRLMILEIAGKLGAIGNRIQ